MRIKGSDVQRSGAVTREAGRRSRRAGRAASRRGASCGREPGRRRRRGRLLRRGGLVAFPTETVYGLGADATRSREAVAGIFAAKDRPRFNPLIAHVATSLDAARAQGAVRRGRAQRSRRRSGPVRSPSWCRRREPARSPISPGRASTASACASRPIRSRRLSCARSAAPSRRLPPTAPGRVSPTEADHVLGDLDGRIDAVLDGGPARVGVESTIVACLDGGPRLLRPGGVPREAIERRDRAGAGERRRGGAARSPPACSPRITRPAPGCGSRRLRDPRRRGGAAVRPADAGGRRSRREDRNLSPAGDLAEAAPRLFSALRHLDASGAATIAVAPIPETGLGEAINDRLRRAAAER